MNFSNRDHTHHNSPNQKMKTLIVAVALQGILAFVSSHVIRDELNYPQVKVPARVNISLVQESTQQVDLCDCGRSTSDRIVGGSQASPGEFPWRMQITAKKTNGMEEDCGATIISPRWLLTAAHCFDPYDRVFIMEPGKITPNPYNRIEGKRYVLHEQFSKEKGSMFNDIALVELKNDLDFSNPNIAPACLPYRLAGQFEQEGKVVASGWGDLVQYSESEPQSTLRKVTLDMIGHKKCVQMHSRHRGEKIVPSQVCTYTPYKDTCRGDSGGSIDAPLDGKWYALGVVSYGHGCAQPNMAGIYTRVSEFTSWIEKTTGIRSFCKA